MSRESEDTRMTTVSASEFSARAQELLKSVEAGNTIVVHRDGTPIARLEPNAQGATHDPPPEGTDGELAGDDTSSDVQSYSIRPRPLTEFRFGTASMTVRSRTIDVNLGWMDNGGEDDE
jgi:antitoxin (DNA-binding transcriptional repressor) of toxin-antitoxin stability system